MTLALMVVCEARADFCVASELADRVICERVDWITESVFDDYRCWRGADDSRSFLTWTDAAALAQTRKVRVFGHFAGQPGEAYAVRARTTLQLIGLAFPDVAGVILMIDDDGDTTRRDGLRQARDNSPIACPVVLGVAHLKREAWVLAGYVPDDERETQLHADTTRELGFDPCLHPDRLTARGDAEPRSAKRIVRLLAIGWERESHCWLRTPLPLLRARGQAIGLTEYLDEIESRLVPLFTSSAS